MKKIAIIFLFFIANIGFGQTVQIDTLIVHSNQDFLLKFPIIENEKTGSKINADLRTRFLGNEFSEDISPEQAIIEWTEESIIFLDFDVTFNKNGILSLNITAEGCGAYCTTWTEYYNYSTVTGAFLEASDIINISEDFEKKVVEDKNTQYQKAKQELEEMFLEPDSGLDEQSYNEVLEYYKTCENSFEINVISLHNDYLEIIHECHLRRMIRNLEPYIELKYNYKDIAQYLKIKAN